jgi:AcrR family transcriptional regulator
MSIHTCIDSIQWCIVRWVSRERVRSTREETRRRLFEAAAGVFARHGVAGATVEQLAAAAGFSRGAFYSNFSTKEELALAMLEDHLEISQRHNRALLAAHPDPADLVGALRNGDRTDPLHQNPLLQVELMLHVARTPSLRPRVGEHIQIMRELVGEIAAATVDADALGVTAHELGLMLVALEDGLRLHRIVDPGSTPEDSFLDVLDLLQRVFATRPRRGRRTPSDRPEAVDR